MKETSPFHAYSAEKQALRCMQKTLKMASAPAPRKSIQLHIEQTQVLEMLELIGAIDELAPTGRGPHKPLST